MRPSVISLLLLAAAAAAADEPLALHPANGRYLVFRGRPTVLVGSGEHYGAVLNLDFDYRRYLGQLATDGLNLTRTFTGAYVEKPGDFGIRLNTLAPAPGRFAAPWARGDTPGYAGGGNKFDLSRWDPAYFARLKDFVAEAGRRGIVVELVLFSSFYRDGWSLSPLNAPNNVNAVGAVEKARAQTLDNGGLLEHQLRLARKVVAELAAFDNVYFEVQNEPWADHPVDAGPVHPYLLPHEMRDDAVRWKNRVEFASKASLDWQARIVSAIAEEEARLGRRHLIAQNYCNFGRPLRDLDARVSILNFHYAWPEAATWNLGWERVLAFDETGFAGPADETYREQAWSFLLSGGAVFSHLDYSFAVGREDGTADNDAPGGGSPALRRQLRVLLEFLSGFDLPALAPRPDVVVRAPGAVVRALGAEGRAYALYVRGDGETVLTVSLPAGRYREEWVDTKTGAIARAAVFTHGGGTRDLASPSYARDVALRLSRTIHGAGLGLPHE